jgi:hypothetical protein
MLRNDVAKMTNDQALMSKDEAMTQGPGKNEVRGCVMDIWIWGFAGHWSVDIGDFR